MIKDDTYCVMPFLSLAVKPDGKVKPCCRYKTWTDNDKREWYDNSDINPCANAIYYDRTGISNLFNSNTNMSSKKMCKKNVECEYIGKIDKCLLKKLYNGWGANPVMAEYPIQVNGENQSTKTQHNAKGIVGLPYDFNVTCGTIKNDHLSS